MTFKDATMESARNVQTADGVISDELVEDLMASWVPRKPIDFKRAWYRARAASVLNGEDYYATKGVFRHISDMTDEEKMDVARKLEKIGKTYIRSYARISGNVEGQYTMNFKDDGSIEINEVV